MPTLSEYWDNYETYTVKASDIARQLSFVGVAVVWIFRTDTPDGVVIPKALLCSLGLFVLALSFDLLQYIAGVITWQVFCRHHENNIEKPEGNPELTAPPWINYPTMVLFWLKILSVVVAYVVLLMYCARRFSISS